MSISSFYSKFFLFLSAFPFLLSAQPTLNVKDFGASGNKAELATQAIQAAIDSAHALGGAQVYLPPGDYLSGTIIIKSNVTLWLEAGATIFASHDGADYSKDHRDLFKNPVLLYAKDAHHITLRGKGKIDGEAKREYLDLKKVDKFIKEETEIARAAGVEMKMYYKVSPITGMLYFKNCEDITITDLSFIESTFWTLHLELCKRAYLRGLYVYSDLEKGVNADGIDIAACTDVTISDCIVITGDDAICMKTKYKDGPVENVTVTNCVLTSSSTGLKIGTESRGDFRHIVFNNCVIRNSNRGLSIVVRDGGTVSDILFSNITIECSRRHFNWWGDADPIWLVVLKRYDHSPIGKIENVRFQNILATGRGTSRIESIEGRSIHHITMDQVRLHMAYEDAPDKRVTHAFEAIKVDDLRINDLEVSWATDTVENTWQQALSMQAVYGLEIDGFRGRQGLLTSQEPVIKLQKVHDAILTEIEGSEGSNTLIEVTGEENEDIRVARSNLREKADKLVEVSGGASKKTVKKVK